MKGKKGAGGRKGAAKKLTPRQEKFVEGVLKGKSGARAARDAGYSEKRARVTASELTVANRNIRERIRARQADAQVQTNEVIGTLASHMRGDVGDIIPENPIVAAAKKVGLSHLIKKLVIKTYYDKHLETTVEETTFELHSAQAAAKQLCAVFGLNKEAAANPHDAARAAYEDLMSRFDLKPEEAAPIVSEQFGLPENEFVN